jgi:L-threonylcarbamoyladenylate synthase
MARTVFKEAPDHRVLLHAGMMPGGALHANAGIAIGPCADGHPGQPAAMVEVDAAAAVIRRGGVVAMPTETVYGLAADATGVAAVARIFELKGRPAFDPLIVHVEDAARAMAVAEVDAGAARLMEVFWPGPLTLVLPRRAIIPDLVTSGLPTVGVRCPDHPLARRLIAACDRPLAAPSANRFGRLSPTTAAHVRRQFSADEVPILDGGPCRIGVESTVVVVGAHGAVVLRPGAIALDDLAAALGRPVRLGDTSDRVAALPRQAPGLLRQHYAPLTPLRLRDPDAPWPVARDCGRLAFTGADLPPEGGATEILSPSGDLAEAANRLFAALSRLDAVGNREIVAELVPATGIGMAINDRLCRAAGLG